MSERRLGQVVTDWSPPAFPTDLNLKGSYASLVPLAATKDAGGLWRQMRDAPWLWDYLFEPAPDEARFRTLMGALECKTESPAYVIRSCTDPAPLGYACFWTNVPVHGCTEIGNVNLSPALQRTPIATEAFFLMIDWAITAGYRRVEWKCNALNLPSRRAAERLGFSYEGVFRHHMIVKGRNRDTAWFAITNADWAMLRPVYLRWLAAENFSADGSQKKSLSELTQPYLVSSDQHVTDR